ncbi:MAG TPA: hypothetical protein PL032_05785 [Syntrophorhabdus sp.]|nr:MAG: hypothetical protein A4E59_02145 [Syntrophorhabdus sp. PtaB.Bin027]OQB78283.1 MAG: hypothetical protein BWX92_00194 [Deltaproteobacteria bacterium ADurb.Bin135]HNQ45523.1 hypothetical protein [Syntrophorhabdus sp.]HNY69560.1 hypothetical protein [Syntrophorhabdus sp.]HOH26472.1 hypothetical protein [Syntrophorhabdus sp.]
MTFRFKNTPQFIPLEVYENEITTMIERLNEHKNIVSVYQVGTVQHPGISDIDMLVVLKDDAEFYQNPLKNSSVTGRYLFVHPLLGVTKTDFMEAQHFNFFRNWRLLLGEQLITGENKFSSDEIACLQIQIALEYLLSNYIQLTVMKLHRIVNIRALLLNMKAMLYDLRLLNVSSGPLYDLLERLVAWRDRWFEEQPHYKDLTRWINLCYLELGSFLQKQLQMHRFYLPKWGNLHVTKNVVLSPNESFSCKCQGMPLPVAFAFLGKKYLKLQRKLNKVTIFLPIQREKIPSILIRKFNLESKMVQFNLDKPFLTLRSTLNFLRKVHR